MTKLNHDPGRDYLMCVIPCIALMRHLAPDTPIYVVDYTEPNTRWDKYDFLNFEVIRASKNDNHFNKHGFAPILLRPYETNRFSSLTSCKKILYCDMDQMFLKSPTTMPVDDDKINICRTNGGMICFDKTSSNALAGIRILKDFTEEVLKDKGLKDKVLDYYVSNGYHRHLVDEAVNLFVFDHNVKDIQNYWQDIPKKTCLNDYTPQDITDNQNCWSVHLHSGSLPKHSIRVRGLIPFFLEETYEMLVSSLKESIYKVYPSQLEAYKKFKLTELNECIHFVSQFWTEYEMGRVSKLL